MKDKNEQLLAKHKSLANSEKLACCYQGRCQGEGGGNPPPSPETEKIVVEKWCYLRGLYF